MSKLLRYTITMPEDLFKSFDRRNRRKGYRNRSEAIRDLVRDALVRDEWSKPDQHVAATLTIVYDHHTRGLTDKLTEAQHRHGEAIVATMHVHLDHHNCLEVIVLRGPAAKVQSLADALAAIKGVKHSNLALTTEGKTLH
jgi:CopG family nickel-responsive transcriptional regulator